MLSIWTRPKFFSLGKGSNLYNIMTCERVFENIVGARGNGRSPDFYPFTEMFYTISTKNLSEAHCMKIFNFISCFPVGYREKALKMFFYLTLVPPVKIPIFTFVLPKLIARASQPDENMT